jgi:hypothetical protein
MSVISALGRLQQEDHQVEASLGYTVRHCLKKKKIVRKGEQRKERKEGREGRRERAAPTPVGRSARICHS